MRPTRRSRGLAADLLILTGGGLPITGALGQPPVGTQEPRHTPPLRERATAPRTGGQIVEGTPGFPELLPSLSLMPSVWPKLTPWACPSTQGLGPAEGRGPFPLALVTHTPLQRRRPGFSQSPLEVTPKEAPRPAQRAPLGPGPSFQPAPQGGPADRGAWASGLTSRAACPGESDVAPPPSGVSLEGTAGPQASTAPLPLPAACRLQACRLGPSRLQSIPATDITGHQGEDGRGRVIGPSTSDPPHLPLSGAPVRIQLLGLLGVGVDVREGVPTSAEES